MLTLVPAHFLLALTLLGQPNYLGMLFTLVMMKLHQMLLLLLLVAQEVWSQCSTLEPNTDYWGNDVASTQWASPNECCNYCDNNPQCKACVWSSNTCWLKNVKGTKSVVMGAQAGTMLSQCTNARANIDWYGNDLGSTTCFNPANFCTDCNANSKCIATMWTGGTCWLKHTIEVQSTKQGMQAYIVRGRPTAQCTSPQANINWYGNDLGSTTCSNPADCCTDCKANPKCVATVWTGGTCW
jgi:hypothetical protein